MNFEKYVPAAIIAAAILGTWIDVRQEIGDVRREVGDLRGELFALNGRVSHIEGLLSQALTAASQQANSGNAARPCACPADRSAAGMPATQEPG
ncbi:MAG: hypothetical protein OXF03_01720 [Gammaproteobacteria bacterium]|nr:hypothetical protein [Gammaproteobacteria bacterium]MCY4255866.1 hypothetical protein [Gammaproteobacteria bacterium]